MRLMEPSVQTTPDRPVSARVVVRPTRTPGAAAPAVGRRGWIARREWVFAAAIALFAVALVEIPYAIAYAQAANGAVFVGMLWVPTDMAQYIGAMREGAASTSWLIHDHLSSEPHPPVLMYTYYVALGKLAGLVAADQRLTYHAAEIASRAGLVVVGYVLASELLERPSERRLALILMVFASGLTALLITVSILVGAELNLRTVDFHRPEISTFVLLFTAPHFQFGMTLILLIAFVYARSWRRSSVWNPALGAVASMLLGLTNSFSLVPVIASVGGHAALMVLLRRRLWSGGVATAAAVIGSALPFVAYSALVFRADPFWSDTYWRQNFQLSAAPLDLAIGYGAVLLLALVGVRRYARSLDAGRAVVLVWAATGLALMYAPLTIQSRFGIGVQPMLAILAAVGFGVARQTLVGGLLGRLLIGRVLLTVIGVQALFGSSLLLLLAAVQQMSAPPSPYADSSVYRSAALNEVGRWLAPRIGESEVIVAETLTANHLAGMTRGRVYAGHTVATLDYDVKDQEVNAFYSSLIGTREGRQWLLDRRIRYLVVGPRERALREGPIPLDGLPEPAFSNDDYLTIDLSGGAE
ncbi:MAG: hypothetical protein U0821_16635 [Chloroflexota bacterium]